MYYQPVYFEVEELVPPDLFAKHGRNSLYFLDDRITITLDRIREYFSSPVTINNWNKKGTGGPASPPPFTQRGYRNNPSTGPTYSAHRFGRAVDFDIKGITSEEFRKWAGTNESSWYLTWITRIENGVSWNHIDCMGPPKNGHAIIFFDK